MDTTLIVIILGIALLAIVMLPRFLSGKKDNASMPPGPGATPTHAGSNLGESSAGSEMSAAKLATLKDVHALPLARWLTEKASAQTGIDLTKDPLALTRILEAARKAQSEIEKHGQAEIALPYIAADAKGPKHFQIVVTREQATAIGPGLL